MNEARPRALDASEVRREGDELVFEVRSGQRAGVRAAGEQTLRELKRWDAFYYNVLTTQEEAELEELVGEWYWGRWASPGSVGWHAISWLGG